jgi:hypothetical protein
MKLYLPFVYVALLSIGIAQSAAAEDAIEDLTEASRARSLTPARIDRNLKKNYLNCISIALLGHGQNFPLRSRLWLVRSWKQSKLPRTQIAHPIPS